jgi:hypothetical protein
MKSRMATAVTARAIFLPAERPVRKSLICPETFVKKFIDYSPPPIPAFS